VPVIQGIGDPITVWIGEKLALENHEMSERCVVASANVIFHEQTLEILSKPKPLHEGIPSSILPRTQSLTPWIVGILVGEMLEQFLHNDMR